jgi:hypothetical protein
MSNETESSKTGSPEVQTFGMPKPPPPPPEDPKDKEPPKASASHWVILIFLAILGSLLGFYYLYWNPRMEAEKAAAAAAAAYVRPWSERAEEAIHKTFEGQAGTDFAASIQAVLDPEGTDAKLQGMDLTPSEQNMVTIFRVSWSQAAPEDQDAAQLTLSTASIKWTSADKKNLGAEYMLPEGGTPLTEDQKKGLDKIFSTQVHPLVRRNTADR